MGHRGLKAGIQMLMEDPLFYHLCHVYFFVEWVSFERVETFVTSGFYPPTLLPLSGLIISPPFLFFVPVTPFVFMFPGALVSERIPP